MKLSLCISGFHIVFSFEQKKSRQESRDSKSYTRILPDFRYEITSCGIVINSFQYRKSKKSWTKKTVILNSNLEVSVFIQADKIALTN